MTDALDVWAAAAARAVLEQVNSKAGDAPPALVHAQLHGAGAVAPTIIVVRASDLTDRAAIRDAIFDRRFPGQPVQEYLSTEGVQAFEALDALPPGELVDALQAALDSAPWPVLVTGRHDAAERAKRRFTR